MFVIKAEDQAYQGLLDRTRLCGNKMVININYLFWMLREIWD